MALCTISSKNKTISMDQATATFNDSSNYSNSILKMEFSYLMTEVTSMLVTDVGDKFKMSVTALTILVINIHLLR